MRELWKAAFEGQTVLVTGDTGFKGSWLSIWLQRLGARVVGYALPPIRRNDNYVVTGLSERLIHFDADVRDFDQMLAVFREHRPTLAFHLAAQALVLESYRDPRTTFDTNIMGVVNFLEAVRATPSVRAAVVVTSDKCYENREWVHGYREIDTMGGEDPYSASKGAAELVASSLRRSFFGGEETARVATARAGNVLGGGDWAQDRLIPDCLRALKASKPIVIRNPDAVRPWQHVLEPLSGYLLLAARLLGDGGAAFEGGWNFGPLPAASVSVRKLTEAMLTAWGHGSLEELNPDAPRSAEAHHLALDISKALNVLGWTPRLSLEQTIAMTVEGYQVEGMSTEQVYEQRIRQITTYEELADG